MSKRLVLVDVQGDLLDKTVDECKKLGALEVITLVYDLSTYKNCRLTISTFKKVDNGFREVIEKSIAVLGGIDIVLFNHVLMTNNFAENLTYGEVERSVSVNLLSHIYLSNLTIPHLKQSKGHICAVASIGGRKLRQHTLFYLKLLKAIYQYQDSAFIAPQNME